MKELMLYEVGSDVKIGDNISAKIRNIEIYQNDGVYYNCSWWENGVYKTQLLTEGEVNSVENSEKMKIGFHKKYGKPGLYDAGAERLKDKDSWGK